MTPLTYIFGNQWQSTAINGGKKQSMHRSPLTAIDRCFCGLGEKSNQYGEGRERTARESARHLERPPWRPRALDTGQAILIDRIVGKLGILLCIEKHVRKGVCGTSPPCSSRPRSTGRRPAQPRAKNRAAPAGSG